MAHWLNKIVEILEADTKDLRELAIIAGYNPATFYLGTPMDGADMRGQNLTGMDFTILDVRGVLIDENTILPERNLHESIILLIVHDILAHSRQEERFALLIDSFLKYPDSISKRIVDCYPTDTSITNKTIEALKGLFRSTDTHPTQAQKEIQSSLLIKRLWGSLFPQGRGIFLAYAARHLSKYSAIRQTIKGIFERSTSIYVHKWADAISRELEK